MLVAAAVPGTDDSGDSLLQSCCCLLNDLRLQVVLLAGQWCGCLHEKKNCYYVQTMRSSEWNCNSVVVVEVVVDVPIPNESTMMSGEMDKTNVAAAAVDVVVEPWNHSSVYDVEIVVVDADYGPNRQILHSPKSWMMMILKSACLLMEQNCSSSSFSCSTRIMMNNLGMIEIIVVENCWLNSRAGQVSKYHRKCSLYKADIDCWTGSRGSPSLGRNQMPTMI